MAVSIESILQELPRCRDEAQAMQDIVLANLVAIGEVPAPSRNEDRRIRMLLERFNECGLQTCSTDVFGNGMGMLPGTDGKTNILLFSNVDTLADEHFEPSLSFRKDEIIGPFIGDNSLALAAMTSLPILLDRLQIRLKSNLIVMGAVRMLGHGNLEGLNGFLNSSAIPIHYGLSLEGIQLGRLNYACLGQQLCDITVRLPEDYNWVQFGATGAIIPMNDIINRINKIPLPRRPMTTIVFGMIRGGVSYRNIARDAVLSFEVRSESAELLNQIAQQIEDITEDVTASAGVHATFDIFARRAPGGLDISHPFIRQTRAIHTALGMTSQLYPTTFALGALVEKKIPALVLGLTSGTRRGDLPEMEEAAAIEPMWTGLAQLIGVLLAIDGGFCDVV
ncbi:MAG: peptidase dimerization domain-containing protein [Kiritimatiellae bacterium]|nr:peptidase dimerization domain-containing protein [Kiritimatiellia bacterium]